MARFEKGSIPMLTEKLIVELSSFIAHGCYVETAVALCGISKQTFYRWLKDSQKEDASDLLLKLSDAVKKAAAESEVRDLAVIDKAAQEGVWQAAAWRLERKHPERWGRQSKVQLEHTGSIEAIDRTEQIKKVLSDPDALRAIEMLEAKLDDKSSEDGSD
jgi:transposase